MRIDQNLGVIKNKVIADYQNKSQPQFFKSASNHDTLYENSMNSKESFFHPGGATRSSFNRQTKKSFQTFMTASQIDQELLQMWDNLKDHLKIVDNQLEADRYLSDQQQCREREEHQEAQRLMQLEMEAERTKKQNDPVRKRMIYDTVKILEEILKAKEMCKEQHVIDLRRALRSYVRKRRHHARNMHKNFVRNGMGKVQQKEDEDITRQKAPSVRASMRVSTLQSLHYSLSADKASNTSYEQSNGPNAKKDEGEKDLDPQRATYDVQQKHLIKIIAHKSKANKLRKQPPLDLDLLKRRHPNDVQNSSDRADADMPY